MIPFLAGIPYERPPIYDELLMRADTAERELISSKFDYDIIGLLDSATYGTKHSLFTTEPTTLYDFGGLFDEIYTDEARTICSQRCHLQSNPPNPIETVLAKMKHSPQNIRIKYWVPIIDDVEQGGSSMPPPLIEKASSVKSKGKGPGKGKATRQSSRV